MYLQAQAVMHCMIVLKLCTLQFPMLSPTLSVGYLNPSIVFKDSPRGGLPPALRFPGAVFPPYPPEPASASLQRRVFGHLRPKSVADKPQ